jgi:aminoglycoside phosphotransferase (APT) family kinase protein
VVTELTPDRDAELRRCLHAVCRLAGVDATPAELIKYTVNAVYRLPAAGVVVRVADDAGAVDRARQVVGTARWLAARRAPAVRLLEGVPQPVTSGLCAATFWVELGGQGERRAADLAGPLRELHRLPVGVPLRPWSPFESAARRMAAADGLAAADRQWLGEQWAAAERTYRTTAASLRTGLVHGDAHAGNLLRDGSGGFVLCDLDSTGIGPLDWDLVPAAVAAFRFGEPASHAGLAAAYGRDVTTVRAWPLLRRIRELVMVTSVVPDLRHRPAVAAEHAHRMRTLRAGDTQAPWRRY